METLRKELHYENKFGLGTWFKSGNRNRLILHLKLLSYNQLLSLGDQIK